MPIRSLRTIVAHQTPVTARKSLTVLDAARTMKEHKVRRLPVIDGHDLIGMLTQADVARSMSDRKIGDLVEYISA